MTSQVAPLGRLSHLAPYLAWLRCTAASLSCVLPVLQFELRYEEVGRARAIFERYVEILPSIKVRTFSVLFYFKL